MQKTRKRSEPSYDQFSNAARSRYTIPLPEVTTIDVLDVMLDEDLIARYRALDEERNKVFMSGLDSRPWEEELAYVRREQQIRQRRRDAHFRFESILRGERSRSEDDFPAGDFDNSAFVYAATGGRPRWN